MSWRQSHILHDLMATYSGRRPRMQLFDAVDWPIAVKGLGCYLMLQVRNLQNLQW